MNDEPDFVGTNPEHVTEATTSFAESTSPPDAANQPAGHTPEPETAGDATSSDRITALDLENWPVADLSRLISSAKDIRDRKANAERQAFIDEARKRAADLGLNLADVLGDQPRGGGDLGEEEDDEGEASTEESRSRAAAKPAGRTASRGARKTPSRKLAPKSPKRRAAPLSIATSEHVHAGERFRGPNGETWKAQGKGRKPKWLYDLIQAGHSLDEYRIVRGRKPIAASHEKLAAD